MARDLSTIFALPWPARSRRRVAPPSCLAASAAPRDSGLLETCLGSAAASIIARIVCHPLDTAKARLQARTGADYRGTVHVLRSTFAEEGVRGLYRGFGAVVLGGTPGTCLYLTSYEWSKKALEQQPALSNSQFLAHFASGMVAETVCCMVYVPVDVVKERLQVQRGGRQVAVGELAAASNANAAAAAAAAAPAAAAVDGGLPRYTGSLQAAGSIMATEGLAGIYKGYGATLASFGPFSAFYFMFYEQLKEVTSQALPDSVRLRHGDREDLPFVVTLLNAAFAGAAASWITSPLDLAKLRLQVERGRRVPSEAGAEMAATSHYRGFFDVLSQTYRAEGVKGLFRGSGARMAFHAPATAVTMASFEQCRRFFEKLLGRSD